MGGAGGMRDRLQHSLVSAHCEWKACFGSILVYVRLKAKGMIRFSSNKMEFVCFQKYFFLDLCLILCNANFHFGIKTWIFFGSCIRLSSDRT